MSIHPTAIVSPEAEVDATAEIGAFSIIEERVVIGERTVVESHSRIGSRYGHVRIGADNLIQHGATLGGPAQDYSYESADTALVIGNGNRFGEYCTVNLGTEKGGGVTRIGDRNFIMAYAHVGHDCRVEDHVVITNGTQLAGHVLVEHHAMLGGITGVTQFVRLGAYSFLAAGAFANKDIPPYTIAEGHWAAPRAVNKVGLRRAGFAPSARKNVELAVRLLLDRGMTIQTVCERIRAECEQDELVTHLLRFVAQSDRGIARP